MAAKRVKTRYPGIYSRTYADGTTRYIVMWRDRGKLEHETFRTLAEAREAQGRRRQPGEKQVYSRERFDEYAPAWLERHRGRSGRGIASSTRRDWQRSLERWAVPFFGRMRVADIDPRDIRAFIAWMEKKDVKPPSIRKNLVPLKALFASAVADGHIRASPTVGLRLTTNADDGERTAKALTRQELQVLLGALPDEWRPFFTFLAQTGLRISEALALTWDDVELGTKPRVRVERQLYRGELTRLKTSYSRREVPLSPNMARTLLALRAERYEGPGAPLWSTRIGTPLSAHNVRNRVLTPTAQAVALPWVHFHTFRHTCASLLFAGGKDVKQVQEWLGHADPGFTLRTYVHLLDEGLGSADFLDGALEVASGLPGRSARAGR